MIGNTSNKIRYSILSTTPIASYEIPFKYWIISQIVAKLVDVDGNETTLASSNYTVSTPGDSGSLSFVDGYIFPENAETLTILRICELEQLTDLRNGDVLDADVIEKSLDILTAILQQINERTERAVVIPVSDPDADMEIPSSQVRSNMLLGFDSDGVLTVVLTTEIEQKLSDALAAEENSIAQASAALASANAASGSASAANASKTAAASSASAASASASNAASSASSADASKTAAAASASAANASKTAAASSASAASVSESNAATSETNALNSKNSAASSASAAAGSASSSASSASESLSSKNASAGSASSAASSASASALSESNALASKNAAATSESNAGTSASAAASSASNASTSEGNAATSEANALIHAQSAQAADAAANKHIVIDGTTYQYSLSVSDGRVNFDYEEVV